MPRLPAVPEVLEVELTRRAAGGLVGRRLLAIERTDPLIVADGVDEVLPGCTVTAVAVLLDQTAVAGLGNLLVDEVLWWAGLDPRRPATSLTPDENATLHQAIRRRLPIMLRRGGSHAGTLSPVRRATGGLCPRDRTDLAHGVVAGRGSVWCPSHQR